MNDIDQRLDNVARGGLIVAIFGTITGCVLGIGTGIAISPDAGSACPEPQYDVNRVVKMHEEQRKCEVELEEARDNVLVCGRLLKRALE